MTSIEISTQHIRLQDSTTFENLIHHWLPHLTQGPLKVLLAIIYRILGCEKQRDKISLSQLQKITGLTKTNTRKSIEKLIEMGAITIETVGKPGMQETFYDLTLNRIDEIEKGPVLKKDPPTLTASKPLENQIYPPCEHPSVLKKDPPQSHHNAHAPTHADYIIKTLRDNTTLDNLMPLSEHLNVNVSNNNDAKYISAGASAWETEKPKNGVIEHGGKERLTFSRKMETLKSNANQTNATQKNVKSYKLTNQHPLKKEQEPYFEQIIKFIAPEQRNNPIIIQEIFIVIREAYKLNRIQKLRDGICHIGELIKQKGDGNNKPNNPIGYIRSIIRLKTFNIFTEKARDNRDWLQGVSERTKWNLIWHFKFVRCPITNAEIPFDLDKSIFEQKIKNHYYATVGADRKCSH